MSGVTTTRFSNPMNWYQKYLFSHWESQQRQDKLLEMIHTTARTATYGYTNIGMYYLITIIWKTTAGNRTPRNGKKKRFKTLSLSEDLSYHPEEESPEIKPYDVLRESDVYRAALELSKQEKHWWKYEIWKDYYVDKKTYKQLSEKYDLTISPLFYVVKNFNADIRDYLVNNRDLNPA